AHGNNIDAVTGDIVHGLLETQGAPPINIVLQSPGYREPRMEIETQAINRALPREVDALEIVIHVGRAETEILAPAPEQFRHGLQRELLRLDVILDPRAVEPQVRILKALLEAEIGIAGAQQTEIRSIALRQGVDVHVAQVKAVAGVDNIAERHQVGCYVL